MAPPDPTKARFPDVPAGGGLYESWFLEASSPAERLGVWIRYTIAKRPGAAPTGSLWFTLFDGPGGRTHASKVTLPTPVAGGEGWIAIGEARLGPGVALGAARSERCDAAWELRFATREPPAFHLPRPRLYETRLPRTKPLAVAPAARFDGRLELDGRELRVGGWRGTVGHNWGAAHAERWVWLHGVGFDDAERSWLDAAVARVALGPLTTPWLCGGVLSLDGERHRLGAPGRRVRMHVTPGHCAFLLTGDELTVLGEASAPAETVVAWPYASPDGAAHEAVHSSLADLTLTVERRGLPPRVLRLAGGAALELGGRELDHGVPVEPFADG